MDDDARSQRAVDAQLIRPYLMTQGRTRARDDLRLETLVRANAGASSPPEPEQAAVLMAARDPASIVDLSARTSLPIGVVRVLITDLEELGSMTVYEGAGEPDEDLVRRLISGVESL
jgi:hypothetical protein